MDRAIFIFFFALFSSTAANAEDEPAWVKKPPSTDSQFYYFVGRGVGNTEMESFRIAEKDAKKQAISEIFGLTTAVTSESNETLGSSDLSEKVREASADILFKEFRQQDMYRLDNEYWVLFRYGRESAASEVKRQEALAKSHAQKSKLKNYDADPNGERLDAAIEEASKNLAGEEEEASIARDAEEKQNANLAKERALESIQRREQRLRYEKREREDQKKGDREIDLHKMLNSTYNGLDS
jgi:hypothetical protein